jgi:hypothetical protein
VGKGNKKVLRKKAKARVAKSGSPLETALGLAAQDGVTASELADERNSKPGPLQRTLNKAVKDGLLHETSEKRAGKPVYALGTGPKQSSNKGGSTAEARRSIKAVKDSTPPLTLGGENRLEHVADLLESIARLLRG